MGQGAGMAIEDAAVLFRAIEAAEGDYADAFKMYRATRIERTSEVQRQSHENVWMKYPTDPTWVYSYDATSIPLVKAPAEEVAA
jgi:6-hydroxynicotinate 3-monooxygenase